MRRSARLQHFSGWGTRQSSAVPVIVGRANAVVSIAGGLLLAVLIPSGEALRSGCHRCHSCPSDRSTYMCGDLGHCSGCPNNQYCRLGAPRRQGDAPVATSPAERGTQAPERAKPAEQK